MSLYTLVHLVGEGLFDVVRFCTLGHKWGCPSALGMCVFLNRLYWFGVVGLCTLGVDQQGRVSSFLNRLYWFGVGLYTLGVNQQGRAFSFLNRLYWFGVVGSVHLKSISRGGPPHFSICFTGLVQQCSVHLGSIRGAPSALVISVFLTRLHWFSLVGLCTLGVDQRRRASLFLNSLYWFGVVGALYTWGQLVGEGLFGAVGYFTLGLNWDIHLHWAYPHFSIGNTGLVQQGLIHLGSNNRGVHICTGYVHISQSVIQVWPSRAPYTWVQLTGQASHLHWVFPYFSIGSTGLVQ